MKRTTEVMSGRRGSVFGAWLVVCAFVVITTISGYPGEEALVFLYMDQPESPIVTDWGDPALLPQVQRMARMAAGAYEVSLGSTASEINAAGFRLYQKGAFGAAEQVFWYATLVDPALVYAHFNRACSIALDFEALDGEDFDAMDAIIYHLNRSVELEPERLEKAKTDSDLDAVRNRPDFEAFLSIWEPRSRRLIIDDGVLYLEAGKTWYPVAPLGGDTDSMGALTVFRTAEFSPDGRYCAFIGMGYSGYRIYLADSTGVVRDIGGNEIVDWVTTFAESGIAWHPEGTGFVFASSPGLRYYHIQSGELSFVTERGDAPESDFDPRFVGPEKISFSRAFVTEYGYGGQRYMVHSDGTGLTVIDGSEFSVQTDDPRGGDGPPGGEGPDDE